jgi:hypothetical protein
MIDDDIWFAAAGCNIGFRARAGLRRIGQGSRHSRLRSGDGCPYKEVPSVYFQT